MSITKFLTTAIFGAILVIFSCSKDNTTYNYPDNLDYRRKSRAGNFLKKEIKIYDAANSSKNSDKQNIDSGKVANSALWKASVSIVGELFPIAVIDSDAGIIATEWYQASPLSNKRVKVNALVKDSGLDESNLRVTVFRQIRDSAKDNWQGAGQESSEKNSGDLTAKLIKEKILITAKSY